MNKEIDWKQWKMEMPPDEPVYSPKELRERIDEATRKCDLEKLNIECLVSRKLFGTNLGLFASCHQGK